MAIFYWPKAKFDWPKAKFDWPESKFDWPEASPSLLQELDSDGLRRRPHLSSNIK